MQQEHYGRFKRPPSQDPLTDDKPAQRHAKRRPTVYDAVAGRVLNKRFLSSSAQTQDTSTQPLRPDEILFKARNAPTRYEETDYYFAHAQLPPDQKLPSGDLLSALHAYISNFYANSQEQVDKKVWKSMDETALIALGILMEESAKEVLGDTGDLVFLEAADENEGMEVDAKSKREWNRTSIEESDLSLDDVEHREASEEESELE